MIVVVDGTIGAGKTTQLNMLAQKGYAVHREPIDEWPLDEFYKDPSRWAFYFHMVVLLSQKPTMAGIHERSILSSRWVFWSLLVKKGLVTDMEDKTYGRFFEKFKWVPDKYIFLMKSPEKAYEHIQTRGQAGDQGVTLEYLKELDVEYKNFLSIISNVHVIDAEKTTEEIHQEILRILI